PRTPTSTLFPYTTLFRSSHVDEAGRARMVSVAEKPITLRTAVAEGAIRMSADAFRQVAEGAVAKGDVLTVSQVAGTLAAKRTARSEEHTSELQSRGHLVC